MQKFTVVYGFSLYPSSPASAVLSTRDFQVLCGDLNIIPRVLDDLNAAFLGIELRPCVSCETVPLITSMSGF